MAEYKYIKAKFNYHRFLAIPKQYQHNALTYLFVCPNYAAICPH